MSSRKVAEQNQKCREIVSEIENFGINDHMRYYIVYLLSQNLEEINDMQELTSFLKDLRPAAFISSNDDKAEPSSSILLDS